MVIFLSWVYVYVNILKMELLKTYSNLKVSESRFNSDNIVEKLNSISLQYKEHTVKLTGKWLNVTKPRLKSMLYQVKTSKAYTMFVFVLQFFVPYIIISVLYFQIYKVLKKRPVKRKETQKNYKTTRNKYLQHFMAAFPNLRHSFIL